MDLDCPKDPCLRTCKNMQMFAAQRHYLLPEYFTDDKIYKREFLLTIYVD